MKRSASFAIDAFYSSTHPTALDKLQEKAFRLADFPELGREREELATGLRSFPIDRYNLYYLIADTKLILVRVLPADRDIHQIF